MVQGGARVALIHRILVRVQVSDPSRRMTDRWRSLVVALGCQPRGHGFKSHTVRQVWATEVWRGPA